MTRVLRSKWKRWLLWKWAGGQCQKCGKPLGKDWHADHIRPWRLTHRTNLFEMQALCSDCNLKKGDSVVVFDSAKLRKGQQEALQTIQKRFREGCSYTAIEMATRYGKSDLIRLATLAAVEAGLVAGGLCLVVSDYLRGQMEAENKWKEMLDRYSVQWPGVLRHRIVSELVENPTANGEIFITTTIQLFQNNPQYWAEWADAIKNKTRKPVVVHVDECQMTSNVNQWGKALMEFCQKTGALVVLYTATPTRADGCRIPGFEYDEIDTKPIKVWKVREGREPHLIAVDLFEGVQSTLRLKAHHRTTFADAWKESPLPLCHVENPTFDIDLSKITGEKTKRGMLSDLEDGGEVRAVLGRALRHPVVINTGCELFLDYLKRYRASQQTCGGIVFCGNDTETEAESNKHAKAIEKALLRLAPTLNIVIATSAEGNGKALIDRFAGGQGDILICKQMASLGVDIPRLKVGLDLSPVRTESAAVQRMMRIATPYNIIRTCAWCTPDDILFKAIYQSVVKDQGGEVRVDEVEYVKTYEKEKEGKDSPAFVIHDAVLSGSKDTLENVATRADLESERLQETLNKFPEITSILTVPQIWERWKSPASSGAEDTGKAAERLREQINELVKDRAKIIMTQPYDRAKWEVSVRTVWDSIYKKVDIPPGIRLKQVSNLDTLQRILSVLDEGGIV